MSPVAKYKFDEFEADLRAAELRRSGARLKLQLQPFQVLVALLERPKEWLTLDDRLDRLRPSPAPFETYRAPALVGVAVGPYLISATAMDYHLLGDKFRILTPGLFVLDMIWAVSPLLIQDRIGLGFALGACAALIYMPFAQRTLIKMIQRRT